MNSATTSKFRSLPPELVRVTVWTSDCPVNRSASSEVGEAEATGATMPLPLSGMLTVGLSGSLDSMVKVALDGPTADGEKRTSKRNCPVGPTVTGGVTLTWKSELSVPTAVMTRLSVPVLNTTSLTRLG